MTSEEEMLEGLRMVGSMLTAKGLVTKDTRSMIIGNLITIVMVANDLGTEYLVKLMNHVNVFSQEMKELIEEKTGAICLGHVNSKELPDSLEGLLKIALDKIPVDDVLKGTGVTPPKPE